MLAKWKVVLSVLLGSAAAQQFADYGYDYDVDYYTPTCKTAIEKTLECDSALHYIVFANQDPSEFQLEKLCTKKCKSSLAQLQKEIEKSCPVAQNNLTLQHGGFATAQDNIHELLDGFTKVCFKDPNTGKFCADVMSSWPATENMTTAQNCSDCALGAIQLGLNSEYTYNERVALDFSKLTKSCSKTGFEITPPTGTKHVPETSTTASPTQSCEVPYTIQDDDTCNGICKSQNVSSYAFTNTNNLGLWCDELPTAGSIVCLPKTCDIYTVKDGDHCMTIAADFNYAFSATQLLSWNPTLNELCSNMKQHVGMQICVSPPGLGHLKPSPTSPTDGASITPAPEPINLANGTNIRCAQYHNVTTGDNCADLTVAAGISLKDFYFLNPSVNKECTNLILGESYCIRAIGDIETYSGYTTTLKRKPTGCFYPDGEPCQTVDTVLSPATMAPGTWGKDKCRVFLEWTETDNENVNNDFNSCKEIARRYKTTVEELKKWNPSLVNLSPCIIKKENRYCVYLQDEYRSSATLTTGTGSEAAQMTSSVARTDSAAASTATSGSEATPSPLAPGTIAGCKDFYKAGSGDYCYKICEDNKVAQKDFIAWNPSVKKDCSLIQKGYWYCVGR